MLVLTRWLGERIMIDNGRIVITLVQVSGERAKIGIEAPEEVRVDREEVFKEREAQRQKGGGDESR